MSECISKAENTQPFYFMFAPLKDGAKVMLVYVLSTTSHYTLCSRVAKNNHRITDLGAK